MMRGMNHIRQENTSQILHFFIQKRQEKMRLEDTCKEEARTVKSEAGNYVCLFAGQCDWKYTNCMETVKVYDPNNIMSTTVKELAICGYQLEIGKKQNDERSNL